MGKEKRGWDEKKEGWLCVCINQLLTQAWSQIHGEDFYDCLDTLTFLWNLYSSLFRHLLEALLSSLCQLQLWYDEIMNLEDNNIKYTHSPSAVDCPLSICCRLSTVHSMHTEPLFSGFIKKKKRLYQHSSKREDCTFWIDL